MATTTRSPDRPPAAPPSAVSVVAPVTLSDATLVAPFTISGLFTIISVRRTRSTSVPPVRTAMRSPVAPAVPLTINPTPESIGVLTCNCAPGVVVPMPTRPRAPVMRSRSTLSVNSAIGLSPPAATVTLPGETAPAVDSVSAPLLAVTARLPVRVTSGVMTEVPAVIVVPAVMLEPAAIVVLDVTDVNAPGARVVPPMVTPSMVPPPRATLLVWN